MQVSDGVAIRPLHNVSRKSDNKIVPKKQANNGGHYRPSGACGGKGVDLEEHHEEHHSSNSGPVAGTFGLDGVRQSVPDERFWRQKLEVGAV